MRMKYAVWGFSLMLLLVTTTPLVAANRSTSDKDVAAIKATVADYIEGYYTSDAARMESSLHPHYLKHTVSGAEGATRMTEQTGLEMVQRIRSGKVTPVAQRVEKITVLDVSGDVASAKLETARWVDYLTLTRLNGEWKIVSVILRENE